MSEALNAADEAEIKLLEALEEEPYTIPGGEEVYDHAKAQAFMCAAIDLAHEEGLNLLELRDACAWIVKSCNAQIANALGELESVKPASGGSNLADGVINEDPQLGYAGDNENGQDNARPEHASDNLDSEEQTHN